MKYLQRLFFEKTNIVNMKDFFGIENKWNSQILFKQFDFFALDLFR